MCLISHAMVDTNFREYNGAAYNGGNLVCIRKNVPGNVICVLGNGRVLKLVLMPAIVKEN